MTDKKGKRQIETIINGSRIFIEDGEVKVILSEEIQKTGHMTVEECYQLITTRIKKLYELKGAL